MKKKQQKFIILRGPAGVGKTTVARELQKALRGKVVILCPDYFYWKVHPGENNKEIVNTILSFATEKYLGEGYSVILEGCLPLTENKRLIEETLSYCRGSRIPFFSFFLDASLSVVLRRNKERKSEKSIASSDIRHWYEAGVATKGEVERELVLDVEKMTTDEIVQEIKEKL